MVQTTDAEVENVSEHGGAAMSGFKQKKVSSENRRLQKSHEKKRVSTDKVLQSIVGLENETSPMEDSKKRSGRTTRAAAEAPEVN